MANQFAIFGMGQFGIELAKLLTQMGGDVLAIDRDFDTIESIKTIVPRAVCVSSTEEASLRALDIENIDAAVVAIGNDMEASILTTAILRRIGVGKIFARATTPLHGEILSVVGAHRVLFPEHQAAREVARHLMMPQIHGQTSLGEDHSVAEVAVIKSMEGKTLKEIDFRNHFNLLVLEIRRPRYWLDDKGETKKEIQRIPIPDHNEELNEEDTLLLVGTNEDIEKFAEHSEQSIASLMRSEET